MISVEEMEQKARAKMLALLGTPEGEGGPGLFVEHHLEEVEAEYWQDTFGTTTPTPEEVIKALVLVSAWSDQDGDHPNILDFSLPDEATNYVVSVHFDGDEIDDVTMES